MGVITGIDHVVIAVADLARAAENWRRLGFTLSPRGQHSAHMGTANHTLMLRRDYFELITVLAPTERNKRRRDFLAKREGISDIALAALDAESARRAWREAGYPAGDLVSFSRPVPRPDGSTMEARFEVTDLPPDTLPGANAFVCGHLTRGAVWLPELVAHANGATAIRRVSFVAPAPEEVARAWAGVTDGRAVAMADAGVAVEIGAYRLEILRKEAATARFGRLPAGTGDEPAAIGIGYAVANAAVTATVLVAGDIPHQLEPGRILVDAAAANGVMVEFLA